MFDIGWSELVVIGIVALIAIGPKELPTVLRSLGHWMGKVRRMANEFQGQFQEALREAEVADLKKQAEDIGSKVTDFASFDPMAEVSRSMDAAIAPEPGGTASASDTATTATEPAAEAASPPPIDVPLPEAPAPVTNDDFAPSAPPASKQAGSGA